jgi:hypothetical protein
MQMFNTKIMLFDMIICKKMEYIQYFTCKKMELAKVKQYILSYRNKTLLLHLKHYYGQ